MDPLKVIHAHSYGFADAVPHRKVLATFPSYSVKVPTCCWPRRGLAAQRLVSWAPQELTDNAALETKRDTEEGWRLAHVAATGARDLLVVAATGDEIRQESWLMPLHPALYPPKGK